MIINSKTIQLKNKTELTLRSVKVTEAAALLEHLKISHTESYRNLNREASYWETVTVAEEEKLLASLEHSPTKFMLGAFDQDRIVAGLSLFGMDIGATRFTGQLGMSIQQAYSGIGLGTAMMSFAIENAKRTGTKRIELSVRTYNDAGIALYEKSGFRKIGTLKSTAFIDGVFVDEYLYEYVNSDLHL